MRVLGPLSVDNKAHAVASWAADLSLSWDGVAFPPMKQGSSLCFRHYPHRASLYPKTVWKWYNEKVNCPFSDSTLDYILTDTSRKCQPSGDRTFIRN